ncbi:MAG: DegT/DnrJ/EryC1/StrS family aminotransferase [Spirochaetes bacterium]|nr:DegT/DnrJ/EryC1/StrS family aminotransferase [Spirochaetota bacterium]
MAQLAIKGGKPVKTDDFPLWPVFDEREEEVITQVLRSGKWWRYSFGEGIDLHETGEKGKSRIAEFQEAFAQHQGAKYGIACHNGTAALEMVIRALEIGVGDEVIVPAYTYVAGSTCVLQSNAVPIFVDVDPNTYNLDPRRVEEAISEKTKAIIPCHFGGQVADMDSLLEIAREHELIIIEDAAHSHGSEWSGKGAGTMGVAGTFSFQNAKNMTAGEGGIVITDSQELADRIESLTWSGRIKGRPWYEFHQLGWNYRMLEFQGAILRVQLRRLEAQNRVRRKNADYLTQLLRDIDGLEPITIDPRAKKYSVHIFMIKYNLEAFKGLPRTKLLEAVKVEGIPVFSGYTHPLYKNPMYLNKRFVSGDFPLGTEYHKDIDYAAFEEKCPVSERACKYEAIWLEHRLFLGSKKDMEDIAGAFRKVQENIDECL